MANLPSWLADVEIDLARLSNADRLPHGILLEAPRGWGLEILTKSLANTLLKVDGDPAELADPDLHWIQTDDPFVKIDEIRELVEFLTRTHQSDGIKLGVINLAERMNQNSSNALLKILEEPPPGKHLILTTTEPGSLLPTIRSRIQRFSVKRVPNDDVLMWLSDQECTGKHIQDLMIEHGNAPYFVLAASQETAIPMREHLIEVWSDPGCLPEKADAFSKEDLTDLVSRWQRIVLRFAQRKSQDGLVFQFYRSLCDLKRMYHETRTLNLRLHFERLLLSWFELRPRRG